MKKFTATCTAGCDYEVEAEYYKIEDDVLTFKDAHHSPVASFNWSRITGVALVNPAAHD